MKLLNIPYYKNPDENNCYQAALKIVLKHFLPLKEFSWEELDQLTAKKHKIPIENMRIFKHLN